MSKTTPEEAIWLAGKHGQRDLTADRSAYFTAVQLAALIDEIRGVDAEPVAIAGVKSIIEGYADNYDTMARDPHNGSKVQCASVATDLRQNILRQVLAVMAASHPAPSQPAAPTEMSLLLDAALAEFEGLELMSGHNCLKAAISAISKVQALLAQPAAPVELPVVVWISDTNDATTSRDFALLPPAWEPLVKLSDAQAAIAAGRKAP